MTTKKSLGSHLKAARRKLGLSLRDLERESGVSNGHISLLESNRIQSPSPRHLHALARAMQIQYGELLMLAGYALPATALNSRESALLAQLGRLSPRAFDQVQRLVNVLEED